MGDLDHEELESVEVDKYCNPTTILYQGNKDWGFESAIGDNLSVKSLNLADPKTYDPKPFIEMNLARIWHSTQDFEKFVKRFTKNWLAMYLHLDIRCESTQPPVGRGGPFIYKCANEAMYLDNLMKVLYGMRGENLPLHPNQKKL
jgi:hypothetical protein